MTAKVFAECAHESPALWCGYQTPCGERLGCAGNRVVDLSGIGARQLRQRAAVDRRTRRQRPAGALDPFAVDRHTARRIGNAQMNEGFTNGDAHGRVGSASSPRGHSS